MRIAQPGMAGRQPQMNAIHLDSIFRAAHLTAVVEEQHLPRYGLDYAHSFDAFNVFFVNECADHRLHEILF
jgi:hypothetical protein